MKDRLTVYISGAITGTDDYMDRFGAAEDKLQKMGYNVINPAKVNAQLPTNTSYEKYMEMSITMLKDVDVLYQLKDWKSSKGAWCEYGCARMAGMIVIGENDL